MKLKDEDMLLNFLIELYEKDHDILQLFEYVFFSNISEEGIKKFIDAFDIEYINNGTWKSIFERILQGRGTGSSKNTNEERYAAVVDEIKHTEGHEFNGIMQHLTDEAGGNIHHNGTVNITSNSISGSSYNRRH